jgi:DNA-directed RNA polymerase specialized sigma24 family protein
MQQPSRPFPDTDRTWIRTSLAAGSRERAVVQEHLMQVYGAPLQQLCRTILRMSAEDAVDVVHGFFASRLARDDYLAGWERSGERLRLWLWRGLRFHAKEYARYLRRLPATADLPDGPDDAATDPGREMDRAFAAAIVRAATEIAGQRCAEDGFPDHWRVWHARYAEGRTLREIADELRVTPNRAVVMLRAPTRRFRAALTEILVRDGVPREDLPRAIEELLDATAD